MKKVRRKVTDPSRSGGALLEALDRLCTALTLTHWSPAGARLEPCSRGWE